MQLSSYMMRIWKVKPVSFSKLCTGKRRFLWGSNFSIQDYYKLKVMPQIQKTMSLTCMLQRARSGATSLSTTETSFCRMATAWATISTVDRQRSIGWVRTTYSLLRSRLLRSRWIAGSRWRTGDCEYICFASRQVPSRTTKTKDRRRSAVSEKSSAASTDVFVGNRTKTSGRRRSCRKSRSSSLRPGLSSKDVTLDLTKIWKWNQNIWSFVPFWVWCCRHVQFLKVLL